MRKLAKDHPNQGFLFDSHGVNEPCQGNLPGGDFRPSHDILPKIGLNPTSGVYPTGAEQWGEEHQVVMLAPESSTEKELYTERVGQELSVADSLQELAQKYNAPLIIQKPGESPGLLYVKEQVKTVELLAQHQESFLIEAPTGSGKTAIASMFIASQLRPEQKILIVAPTRILCTQWEDRINSFIDLNKLDFPCGVSTTSGSEGVLSAKKRLDVLTRPGAEIIILTPEALANDLKKMDPTDFNQKYPVVIIDEADEARKNDAMNIVNEELRFRGVRQILFSAAFENKLEDVLAMARDKGAFYYPVKIPPQLFLKVSKKVSLNDFADEQKRETLTKAQDILLEGQRGYVKKILEALPDHHKQGDKSIGVKIAKILAGAEKNRGWISYSSWNEMIGNLKDVLGIKGERSDISPKRAEAMKAAYAIQYISHLYKSLELSGASTFMHFVACNIAASRFQVPNLGGGSTPISNAKYRQDLFNPASTRNSPVLKAFVHLANHGIELDKDNRLKINQAATQYLKWALSKKLSDIAQLNYQGEELEAIVKGLSYGKTRKPTAAHLLELAHKDLTDRNAAWPNHPKEEALIKDLTNFFRIRGSEGKALIYTYYAEHAFHLKKLINNIGGADGIRGVAITGSNHQGLAERDEELLKYRRGEANVLIFTDVAKKGIDTPAEQLFIYNPPSSGRDLIQLVGRIRNHKNDYPKYVNPETHESVSLAKVTVYFVEKSGEHWGLNAADRGFKKVRERSAPSIEPDSDFGSFPAF
jgi:superfamily II DNA/RNA helicase